jgi:hypothetical protein
MQCGKQREKKNKEKKDLPLRHRERVEMDKRDRGMKRKAKKDAPNDAREGEEREPA